jgi:hypothetical protein
MIDFDWLDLMVIGSLAEELAEDERKRRSWDEDDLDQEDEDHW